MAVDVQRNPDVGVTEAQRGQSCTTDPDETERDSASIAVGVAERAERCHVLLSRVGARYLRHLSTLGVARAQTCRGRVCALVTPNSEPARAIAKSLDAQAVVPT